VATVRSGARARTGAAIAIYTAGGLFWAFLPYFIALQANSIGLSAYRAGLLGSAYLIGFTVASVSAWWWASRFDWRRCVGLALTGILLCLYALAVSKRFPAVAAACFVLGICMGTLWVIAYRVFATASRPDRIFGLAIAISYSALATITLLIGRLVIPAGGLVGLMSVMAALVIVLGSGVMLLPAGAASGAKSVSGQGESAVPVWAGLAGIFLFGLFFAAIWTFALQIGVAAGFNRDAVGAVLSSNLLVTGIGSVAASAVSSRSGRRAPLLLSYGALALCAAALAVPFGFATFAIALIGIGLGVGFCMPFQLGAISSLDEGGRFVSLIAGAQGIGSALGPLLGGAAFDAVGASGVSMVAVAVLALSLVAFLFVLTQPRVRQTGSPVL